jgi:hypothetical protein
MLQVGLPKEAIKIKMQQEGANPAYLDKDPTEQVPLVVESAKVPVSEHPTYSKYFRMLKVGLPKDAVKAKMTQEGANPAYLDKEPDELILVEEVKAGATASIKVEKGPRKKKLHWKGLDASKVGRDSLWADKDDGDIVVDEAEFNQLFAVTYAVKVATVVVRVAFFLLLDVPRHPSPSRLFPEPPGPFLHLFVLFFLAMCVP